MKKLFTLLLFLASMAITQAQDEIRLSSTESKKVQAQLTERVKSVTRMQSNFVQTKSSPVLTQDVVSRGSMTYVSPNQMRWEYTSPEKYAIQVHGDSLVVVRNGVEQPTSSSQRRMIKSMMRMIMGISNGSTLFDAKAFTTFIYQSGSKYRAVMTPTNKSLQRMFSKIEIIFDRTSCQVREINLHEGDKSVTNIRFNHIAVQ